MTNKTEYEKLFRKYQNAYFQAYKSKQFTIQDFQSAVEKSQFSKYKFDTIIKPKKPTKADIKRLEKKLEALKEAKKYAQSIHTATVRAKNYQEQLPLKLAKERYNKEQKARERGMKNRNKPADERLLPSTTTIIQNNLIARLEECYNFCDSAENDFSYDEPTRLKGMIEETITKIRTMSKEQTIKVFKAFQDEQLDVSTFYLASPRAINEGLGKIRKFVKQVNKIIEQAKQDVRIDELEAIGFFDN